MNQSLKLYPKTEHNDLEFEPTRDATQSRIKSDLKNLLCKVDICNKK